TMSSLREASAASARSPAAALLFTTTASSAAARSASIRAAWPCRSPRFPATRSYSTLVAPAASTIAAIARSDNGARPRLVCRITPVALMTGNSVRRSRSARSARARSANASALPDSCVVRASASTARAAFTNRSRSVAAGRAQNGELPVVHPRARGDAHPRDEVGAVRRNDGEDTATAELSVDEDPHRLWAVGGAAEKRAGEVAECRTDDAYRRGDARGNVT